VKQDGKGANEYLEVNHPDCAATQSFQNGPLGLEALSDIPDINRMIQLLNLASIMSRNSKDFVVHCLKSAQISGLNNPSLKIGLYDSLLSSQKLKPYTGHESDMQQQGWRSHTLLHWATRDRAFGRAFGLTLINIEY
jgi:hypothetical protein